MRSLPSCGRTAAVAVANGDPNQISQLETSLRDQGSGTSSTGKVFMSLGSAT